MLDAKHTTNVMMRMMFGLIITSVQIVATYAIQGHAPTLTQLAVAFVATMAMAAYATHKGILK